MKRVHRLETSIPVADCQALFEAAAALDLRIGWLDLESTFTAPAELEEPAALGVFRAVVVAGNRVLALKPLRGAAVLEDLLREHFSGCCLVLLRGHHGAPRLSRDEDGYRVRFEDGADKQFTAEALARALRQPRLRGAQTLEASRQSPAG
jgi:hypothetical protein